MRGGPSFPLWVHCKRRLSDHCTDGHWGKSEMFLIIIYPLYDDVYNKNSNSKILRTFCEINITYDIHHQKKLSSYN